MDETYLSIPKQKGCASKLSRLRNRSADYPLIILSKSVYVSEQLIFHRIIHFLVVNKGDIKSIRLVCKPWNRAVLKNLKLLLVQTKEDFDRPRFYLQSNLSSNISRIYGISDNRSQEDEIIIKSIDFNNQGRFKLETDTSPSHKSGQVTPTSNFFQFLSSIIYKHSSSTPTISEQSTLSHSRRDSDSGSLSIPSSRPFAHRNPQYWQSSQTAADYKEFDMSGSDPSTPRIETTQSDNEEHSSSNETQPTPRRNRRSASHLGIASIDQSEISKWNNLGEVDQMYTKLKKSRSRSSMHSGLSSPSLPETPSSGAFTSPTVSSSKDGLLDQKSRKEDNLRFWSTYVLPQWELLAHTPLVLRYWRKYGIPSSLRGRVWPLVIGNRQNVTKEEFFECFGPNDFEEDGKEEMSEQMIGQARRTSILNDIKRMFPEGSSFKINDEEFAQSLQQVLEALCNYNPELSYVQGMSYIAAMLLNYMEKPVAFICLVNMLQMDFFSPYASFDMSILQLKFRIFSRIFEHNLPELHKHFRKLKILPDFYLLSWCMTLFCRHMDLETAARVWDEFFLDGEQYVFRVSVAILKHCRKKLLLSDAETCQKILRTPLLSLSPEQLTSKIRSIEVPEEVVKIYMKRRQDA